MVYDIMKALCDLVEYLAKQNLGFEILLLLVLLFTIPHLSQEM